MNSTKLIEEAVDQFASLPGIGRKTALRLTLDLLNRSGQEVEDFANAFLEMKRGVVRCKRCFNVSDTELCSICQDPKRDTNTICVVQGSSDVMAIEASLQYRGLYHVLGGKISPMNGIGPGDLHVEELLQRVQDGVEEVILALGTTMEGETTDHYLYKKLSPYGINVSTIARGVSVGNELEYTDEVTLGRSIQNRTPYEGSFSG
ncbi:MAG: recombination mediator RecR [Flavobacteriales bacterium]